MYHSVFTFISESKTVLSFNRHIISFHNRLLSTGILLFRHLLLSSSFNDSNLEDYWVDNCQTSKTDTGDGHWTTSVSAAVDNHHHYLPLNL